MIIFVSMLSVNKTSSFCVRVENEVEAAFARGDCQIHQSGRVVRVWSTRWNNSIYENAVRAQMQKTSYFKTNVVTFIGCKIRVKCWEAILSKSAKWEFIFASWKNSFVVFSFRKGILCVKLQVLS